MTPQLTLFALSITPVSLWAFAMTLGTFLFITFVLVMMTLIFAKVFILEWQEFRWRIRSGRKDRKDTSVGDYLDARTEKEPR